ncbi:chemotaxis protein CheW [Alkalibacterium sp. MB6]|uniref:chemotaxis protein CheW n=1 Tax=Alkalibacterium sp. MB6 TaxID=2081965 RepID=UPI00137AA3CE|nr:chemotaxis protein CheW [Alkalibacterium sp. MB6]
MEQYLLFKAGGQTCGVPINETERIIALENHTPVPDVSSYIVGLQDVEGDVLAIVDLSDRFYHTPVPNRDDAEVVIVKWKDSRIGWLVDEVISVQAFNTDDLIDKDREKVDGLSTSYISAFVHVEDDIIPLIDPHTLFAEEKGEELRKLLSITIVK